MKIILTVLFVSIIIIACNKEKSIDGIVKDYGLIELDGCGWVIEVNAKIYKPTNLDSEFKQNNLAIKFDFKNLNSNTNCGLQADAYGEIEILKIH